MGKGAAEDWESFVLKLNLPEEQQFYNRLFEQSSRLIDFLFSYYKSESTSKPNLLVQTSYPKRFPYCDGANIYVSKSTIEFAKANGKTFDLQGNILEEDESSEYFFLWLVAHEFMHCEQNHLDINDKNTNAALEFDADGYATSGLYRFISQDVTLVSKALEKKVSLLNKLFFPIRKLIDISSPNEQLLLAQRLCFLLAKLAWTDNYKIVEGKPTASQQAYTDIQILIRNLNFYEQSFKKNINNNTNFDFSGYLLKFQSYSNEVVSEHEQFADLIKSNSKLKENIYNI